MQSGGWSGGVSMLISVLAVAQRNERGAVQQLAGRAERIRNGTARMESIELSIGW